MQDDGRIERLIGMAERLVAALESDIAALQDGRPQVLQTAHPEIQRLTALYGREAQGFDIRIAQAAPAPLRSRFIDITKKFREVLQLHTRLLARVKNASEGMIKAIADEVHKMHAPARTYSARPGYPPQSSGAMVFNSVV
jgi:hypothetical protein